MPPTRDPGPPRSETTGDVAHATEESQRLTETLLRGGVPPREVTSMADIRGFRLYRRRYFRQAQAWFEAAVSIDPSYEPSLYNAARTAALLGQVEHARQHLVHLRSLDTPLARRWSRQVVDDPDFAALNAHND